MGKSRNRKVGWWKSQYLTLDSMAPDPMLLVLDFMILTVHSAVILKNNEAFVSAQRNVPTTQIQV